MNMPKNIDCINCLHFWGIDKCNAFPNGIPKEILTGMQSHKKPVEGQDNDIVFTGFDKIDTLTPPAIKENGK